jgi:archaellum biogenesis protein FlaJ (TadC family)
MEWFYSLTEWATENSIALSWLVAVSLGLFLLTPLAVGWLVIRLPKDYIVTKRRQPLATWEQHPVLRMLLLIVKNLLGVILLLAGVIMLFTPGQGLLTIVVGFVLLDFPGKSRLERWLVTRQSVWRSINWLRKRAGQPELEHPA